MTAETTDLVARLREAARRGKPDGVRMLATSELRDAADEIERLRGLLRAILEADERGQGLPFAEAMEAAHAHLESVGAR